MNNAELAVLKGTLILATGIFIYLFASRLVEWESRLTSLIRHGKGTSVTQDPSAKKGRPIGWRILAVYLMLIGLFLISLGWFSSIYFERFLRRFSF